MEEHRVNENNSFKFEQNDSILVADSATGSNTEKEDKKDNTNTNAPAPTTAPHFNDQMPWGYPVEASEISQASFQAQGLRPINQYNSIPIMTTFGIPAQHIGPQQTTIIPQPQVTRGIYGSEDTNLGMFYTPGFGYTQIANNEMTNMGVAINLDDTTQRVELIDDQYENPWEGVDSEGLLPGKYGQYIVTADLRKFKIMIAVHDSRVGTCYLLNRGEFDQASTSKVIQNMIPNQYRSAVTYIRKMFVSEFVDKKFYVQACELGAPQFEGITSTSAWTSALKHYCPSRKNPRLSGPLFFGFALRPIRDACPGLTYSARKKGVRGVRQGQSQTEKADANGAANDTSQQAGSDASDDQGDEDAEEDQMQINPRATMSGRPVKRKQDDFQVKDEDDILEYKEDDEQSDDFKPKKRKRPRIKEPSSEPDEQHNKNV